MKNYQFVGLLLFITLCTWYLTWQNYALVEAMPIEKEVVTIEFPQVVEVPVLKDEEELRMTREEMYLEYFSKLTEDNMKYWFYGYKIMIESWEDKPESLEESFSQEDLNYLYRCVQTETNGADFASQTHVASVIFNRLYSGKWGNSLKGVITAPNQFAYGNINITEQTKEACAFAYEIKDTAQGCLYFHSGAKTETFGGAKWIFSDQIGHHFYKK